MRQARLEARQPNRRRSPPMLRAILLVTASALMAAPRAEGLAGAPGWYLGDWGSCNATCGGGVQRRAAHCLDAYGQALPVGLLCGAPPPAEETFRPCNTEPCDFFYLSLTPWSRCSEPCGGGAQQRLAECMAEGGVRASSDSFCARLDPGTDLVRRCNTAPCPREPSSQWAVGAWDLCSSAEAAAACGEEAAGNATRLVSCRSADMLAELPAEACEGPAPAASKPCQRQLACACSRCDPAGTQSCTPAGACVCAEGWAGPRCSAPSSCASGVTDAAGACCESGVLDSAGGCCASSSSASSSSENGLPTTDAEGSCCASSSLLDACGVCGGPAIAVDARGVCCPGPLDAAGYCCPGGRLDACGVCNGVRTEGPCPEPECGDGLCEQDEGPWRLGGGRCTEDCPLAVASCPSGPSRVRPGSPTALCSDAGRCLVGQGRCDCFRGYAGEACGSCEGGWERNASAVGGACVPALDNGPGALRNAAGAASTPTPTPDASADEPEAGGVYIPAWGIALICTGGAVMAVGVLALLFCQLCLRHHALEALELYPTDKPSIDKEAVMSQPTVFTPAVLRRPYPGEPGWKPFELDGLPKRAASIVPQGWPLVTYRASSPGRPNPAGNAVAPLPPGTGTAPPSTAIPPAAAHEPLLPLLPPGAPHPDDAQRPFSAQETRGPFAIRASGEFAATWEATAESAAVQVFQPALPGAGIFLERPGSRQRPASSRDRLPVLTVHGPAFSLIPQYHPAARPGSVPTGGSVGLSGTVPPAPVQAERPGSGPIFKPAPPRQDSAQTNYARPSSARDVLFGEQPSTRRPQRPPNQQGDGEPFSPMAWGTWGGVDPGIATIREELCSTDMEAAEAEDSKASEPSILESASNADGQQPQEREGPATLLPDIARAVSPDTVQKQQQQQQPIRTRPKTTRRLPLTSSDEDVSRSHESGLRGSQNLGKAQSVRELLGIVGGTARPTHELAASGTRQSGSHEQEGNLITTSAESKSARELNQVNKSQMDNLAGWGRSLMSISPPGRAQSAGMARPQTTGRSGESSMASSLRDIPLPFQREASAGVKGVDTNVTTASDDENNR